MWTKYKIFFQYCSLEVIGWTKLIKVPARSWKLNILITFKATTPRGITLNLFWRVWAGRVHVPGAGGVRAAWSAVWRGVRLHGRVGRADLSTPPQEEEEGYAPLLPAPVLSVKSVPVLNMWTSRNPESCPFWYFRGEAADICTHRVDKSAKPFLQSLELGLLHPVTRRRVCPPPFRSGERGALACGSRGGGVPITTQGHTLWYSMLVPIQLYFVYFFTLIITVNAFSEGERKKNPRCDINCLIKIRSVNCMVMKKRPCRKTASQTCNLKQAKLYLGL